MSKYVPMSAEAAFADIEAIMGSDESALEKTKKLCDKGTVCYDNDDDIPAAAYYDEALATGVLTDENLYEIQFRCGVSYAEHDSKKSIDMLKKAAEGGHVKAMLNLAMCYLRGKGTAKNEKECFAWAQKAAEMGDKMLTWYGRDAANVRAAQALVLIGADKKQRGVPHCGYCGFGNCAGCKAAGGNCAFAYVDLGIAVSSAVATAALDKVDNRIMYSVGKTAEEMGFAEDCVWLGIPLSVSGKSIFYDRGIFHD